MGILDDAIREHLELKRQHGAAQADIERLEQEAFGPAARPGDPGYETGESPIPAAPAEGSEDPTTVIPSDRAGQEASSPEAPSPEASAEPVEAPEAGIFDVDVADDELDIENMNTEDFAAAASGRTEPSPAELARQEHPHLDDTIDHPAPDAQSLSEELEAVAPTPAPEVEEAEQEDEEVVEEEPAEVAEEEPAAATPLVDPDSDELEPPEPISAPAVEEEEEEEEAEEEEDLADDSDADLLEETPEFLKDAPDGEDLWFEQGPPQDFDFD